MNSELIGGSYRVSLVVELGVPKVWDMSIALLLQAGLF